jgi:Secretory pathway protein Sec39
VCEYGEVDAENEGTLDELEELMQSTTNATSVASSSSSSSSSLSLSSSSSLSSSASSAQLSSAFVQNHRFNQGNHCQRLVWRSAAKLFEYWHKRQRNELKRQRRRHLHVENSVGEIDENDENVESGWRQRKWHLALSPGGQCLAVVKHNSLAFRFALDAFAVDRCVWKFPLIEESLESSGDNLEAENSNFVVLPKVGRRTRVAWNCSGQVLAVAFRGTDRVHLLRPTRGAGQLVVRALSLNSFGVQCLLDVAVYSRRDSGDGDGDDVDVFVLTQRANVLWLRLDSRQNCCVQVQQFSVADYHNEWLGAIAFHAATQRLVVSGSSMDGSDRGSRGTLSVWRLDPATPRCVASTSRPVAASRGAAVALNWLQQIYRAAALRVASDVVIERLSVSPDGAKLATIDRRARLRLWRADTLEPAPSSLLHECADESLAWLRDGVVADARWWSDSLLAVASHAGDVCIVRVDDALSCASSALARAERFAAHPLLSDAYRGRFFVLECDEVWLCATAATTTTVAESDAAAASSSIAIPSLSDMVGINDPNSVIGEMFNGDDEQWSPLAPANDARPMLARERGLKLVRTYKVTAFCHTTPDELVQRKLDQRQYREAAALARQHSLDVELVYKHQWRHWRASALPDVSAIERMLVPIAADHVWVLRECVNVNACDMSAARAFADYGADRASRALIDGGGGGGDDDLESAQAFAIYAMLFVLVLERHRTYDIVLRATDLPFDAARFRQFCRQEPSAAARAHARAGEIGAVAVLFDMHGDRTQPHRLSILDAVPGTVDPRHYRELLPSPATTPTTATTLLSRTPPSPPAPIGDSRWPSAETLVRLNLSALAASRSPHLLLRALDDRRVPSSAAPTAADAAAEPPSDAELTDWYCQRARAIDEHSGMTAHAAALIDIGCQKGVAGLDSMKAMLSSLCTLVYDCQRGDSMTLRRFEALEPFERLNLLMVDDDELTFADMWRQRAPPNASLELYLLKATERDAADGLARCAAALELFDDVEQAIDVALQAVYKRVVQPNSMRVWLGAEQLLDALDRATAALPVPDVRVQMLHRHATACRLLQRHSVVPQPAEFLPGGALDQSDALAARKLVEMLCRNAARVLMNQANHDGVDSDVGDDDGGSNDDDAPWLQVLHDAHRLRAAVFDRCIDSTLCDLIVFEAAFLFGCRFELAARHVDDDDERYEAAVLRAAQSFFNSATSVSDAPLESARRCLGVLGVRRRVTPTSEAIKSERALLDAMALLSAHYADVVSMLPVQVRLLDERLELIDRCVGGAHAPDEPLRQQDIERLVHLASLLGASSAHARLRIANAALQRNDVAAAVRLATQLVALRFAAAARLCASIALLDERDALAESRQYSMLSFALAHLSPADDLALYDRLVEAWHRCSREAAASSHLCVSQRTARASSSAASTHARSIASLSPLDECYARAIDECWLPSGNDDERLCSAAALVAQQDRALAFAYLVDAQSDERVERALAGDAFRLTDVDRASSTAYVLAARAQPSLARSLSRAALIDSASAVDGRVAHHRRQWKRLAHGSALSSTPTLSGVDLERIDADAEYRGDALLRIARSEAIDVALQIAEQHDCNRWALLAEHVIGYCLASDDTLACVDAYREELSAQPARLADALERRFIGAALERSDSLRPLLCALSLLADSSDARAPLIAELSALGNGALPAPARLLAADRRVVVDALVEACSALGGQWLLLEPLRDAIVRRDDEPLRLAEVRLAAIDVAQRGDDDDELIGELKSIAELRPLHVDDEARLLELASRLASDRSERCLATRLAVYRAVGAPHEHLARIDALAQADVGWPLLVALDKAIDAEASVAVDVLRQRDDDSLELAYRVAAAFELDFGALCANAPLDAELLERLAGAGMLDRCDRLGAQLRDALLTCFAGDVELLRVGTRVFDGDGDVERCLRIAMANRLDGTDVEGGGGGDDDDGEQRLALVERVLASADDDAAQRDEAALVELVERWSSAAHTLTPQLEQCWLLVLRDCVDIDRLAAHARAPPLSADVEHALLDASSVAPIRVRLGLASRHETVRERIVAQLLATGHRWATEHESQAQVMPAIVDAGLVPRFARTRRQFAQWLDDASNRSGGGAVVEQLRQAGMHAHARLMAHRVGRMHRSLCTDLSIE